MVQTSFVAYLVLVIFELEQGPLNQDSTDMNDYLFGQFLTDYFIPWTSKKKKKIGQDFLVLICICTVPVQCSLAIVFMVNIILRFYYATKTNYYI
jgi:hypothetical protein